MSKNPLHQQDSAAFSRKESFNNIAPFTELSHECHSHIYRIALESQQIPLVWRERRYSDVCFIKPFAFPYFIRECKYNYLVNQFPMYPSKSDQKLLLYEANAIKKHRGEIKCHLSPRESPWKFTPYASYVLGVSFNYSQKSTTNPSPMMHRSRGNPDPWVTRGAVAHPRVRVRISSREIPLGL